MESQKGRLGCQRNVRYTLGLALTLLVVLARGPRPAEAAESVPRLAGVVNLPDLKLAVLEVTPPGEARDMLLAEGQRQADLEVLHIDPARREMKLRRSAKTGAVPLTLTNLALAANPGVSLDCVKLDSVLALFARFTNRTLLRSSLLPQITLTLNATANNAAEAAQAFQAALAGKAICSVPDGDRFLMVVPKAAAARVKPLAAQLKPAPDSGGELFPAGMIQFFDSPPAQVLEVYASVLGRKVQPPKPWPAGVARGIKLETQTPLSKEEASYALATVLEWAGLKLIPVGADLLKAVPAPENRR